MIDMEFPNRWQRQTDRGEKIRNTDGWFIDLTVFMSLCHVGGPGWENDDCNPIPAITTEKSNVPAFSFLMTLTGTLKDFPPLSVSPCVDYVGLINTFQPPLSRPRGSGYRRPSWPTCPEGLLEHSWNTQTPLIRAAEHPDAVSFRLDSLTFA